MCVFIDLAMERVLNIIQEEICHRDHVPSAVMSGRKKNFKKVKSSFPMLKRDNAHVSKLREKEGKGERTGGG